MQIDDFYNSLSDDRETGGYYVEKINFILNNIGRYKRVLDIGCNDGFITKLIKVNDNEVIGCDVSRKQLRKAKKNGINAKYLDVVSEWPKWTEGFEAIVLGDIIEHVFDTDSLLNKCYKSLLPGGRLIITTPNVASVGRRLMLLFGHNPYLEYSTILPTNDLPSVGHIRYYTSKDLKKQILSHNFENPIIVGDKVNLGVFSFASSRLLTNISVNLFCVCRKPK